MRGCVCMKGNIDESVGLQRHLLLSSRETFVGEEGWMLCNGATTAGIISLYTCFGTAIETFGVHSPPTPYELQ